MIIKAYKHNLGKQIKIVRSAYKIRYDKNLTVIYSLLRF